MERPPVEQRDILLVPFPFSDQSGRKVRPVIVISNNEFNAQSEDIIVLGVTSNISRDFYTVRLTSNDLQEGKLFTECCIKVENILKIDKQLVIKKIGKISNKTFETVKNKFIDILTQSPHSLP